MMGEPKFISAFDLSGAVGVATGPAGARPRLETWVLEGGGRPEKLVDLDDRLIRHFTLHQVDLVAYEAALNVAVLVAIGAREQTIAFLRGAIAILEQRCTREGIPVTNWQVQRARQAVLGQGRWPKGEAKRGVMRGCRMLGYSPADDHQADALVGHLFQSALLNPRWAAVQGPLFRAAI